MAWLECIEGGDKGLRVELVQDVYVLGRASDCDVQLTDVKTSRWHCRVVKEVATGIARRICGVRTCMPSKTWVVRTG